MIARLRNLFGKSGTESKGGTPAPQTPNTSEPTPSAEGPAETERQLTAAVTDAGRKGGDGIALGDALMYLANFLIQHDRSAEAEGPLRRVLAIEEGAAPGRPDRLVMALANLASPCRYLDKRAEAEHLYRPAAQLARGDRDVPDGVA